MQSRRSLTDLLLHPAYGIDHVAAHHPRHVHVVLESAGEQFVQALVTLANAVLHALRGSLQTT